jgi:UDP-glucose 4-epimerase
VIIVDNLSNSNKDVLDGIEKITGIRPVFYQTDCNDKVGLEKILADNPGIVGIIHFAASKAVGESVRLPLLYYRNNIVSLLNLLELMPLYGIKGFVFSSSCTVYGQPDILPVTEQAPTQPALTEIPNRETKRSSAIRFMRGLRLKVFCCVILIPSERILPPKSANCPSVYRKIWCRSSRRLPQEYDRN